MNTQRESRNIPIPRGLAMTGGAFGAGELRGLSARELGLICDTARHTGSLKETRDLAASLHRGEMPPVRELY
ncbi:MAG: hypothetical protein IJ806_12270 [Ruminococcus sp.]|nr:hypothetical protein [Ruminococcus sp.]